MPPSDSSSPAIARGASFRWIVRLGVRCYYRRVEITGASRIPRCGPVLLCANHPNSLIDPVMVGLASRRPVRFMAKAPLFDTPVLGNVLRALGMVPAYRGRDDPAQVRHNWESLDTGARILADGHALGIFPEGQSHDVPTVQMVRSGAARMVFKAMELGARGLLIVPIGINYQAKERFRSRVWVRVGEAIDMDAWQRGYDGQSRQAMRVLTAEIESRLKTLVVHLDEPRWEEWLDDLETLAPRLPLAGTNQAMPPGQSAPAAPPGIEPLHRRKRLADAINHFLATDRPRAESIASQIENHRRAVREAGVNMRSRVLDLRGFRLGGTLLWQLVQHLLLAIPVLLGTLHHLVPFVVVRELAARLKAPGNTTVAVARLGLGLPIYSAWYALIAWWMFDYFASWFAWAWLLIMPALGILSLSVWRNAKETLVLWWHQIRSLFRPGRLGQLRMQHDELKKSLQALAEEYAARVRLAERPARRSASQRLARAAVWLLVACILGLGGWFASAWVFDRSLEQLSGAPDLAGLGPERLQARLESDEKSLTAILDGLDDLEVRALAMKADFAAGRRSFQNDTDHDDLRGLLLRYINYRMALLRLVWHYQRHADVADPRLALRSFLVGLTAASLLQEASHKFVRLFEDSQEAVAKLNVGEPAWGIPAGLFDTVRRNLASPANLRLLETARAYYAQLDSAFAAAGCRDDQPYLAFHQAIRRAQEAQEQTGPQWPRRFDMAARDLVQLARSMHYETQAAIATWIGDVKIREPRHRSLIDPSHVVELRGRLRPGDILLERRNWFLSNAFLPGYWPHSALYVGTPQDLVSLGLDKDERVRRHWERFCRPDREGHPHTVIEAISEGVVFASLEHSIGGGDSAAVLRPVVGDEERKKAIARAFNQVGKPYDFEFDFATPDQLVCTEVVYRSYGANAGTLQFPLQNILGRRTMPAIELVRKHCEEHGQPQRQFEFVAFIDGDETTGTSRFRDEPDFLATLQRPAITFLQTSSADLAQSVGPAGWIILGLTGMSLVGSAVARFRRRRLIQSTVSAWKPEAARPPA